MISRHTAPAVTVDANEAVASVAYRLSEIVAIYPITPSSPMAEHCDEWSAAGRPNLWDEVPQVVQMQSEAGVAGALHGSLMGGSLTTTFTASQGLLLMIPNMYKIAGELTPVVLHVSARALATHALSIFGDHSDVMACRSTGFALLASNSPQEAHDLAAIAHAATLKSRVPFLHFFDGFRTSHEINQVELLPDTALDALIDEKTLQAFHRRGLTPDAPTLRGTAQNPDTYFQAREAVNPFYHDTVKIVTETMEQFATLTGRRYRPFDYEGDPEAESVIVIMGSGAETAAETVDWLNAHQGKRCGVLKVRLYRPFSTRAFLETLPPTVKRIAVLDRTKEPGAIGEPLHLDVIFALNKARTCPGAPSLQHDPIVIGGRYGLGSKEFTPAMVQAIFAELEREAPMDHFTIGIRDDVTNRSLPYDANFSIERETTTRAVFYGLGSDGTVGANKNTIKVIGDATELNAQAYFVYDSKKSGGLTVSHLRFSKSPIRAPYLIEQAQFVGCHQEQFLGRVPVEDTVAEGGTLLLNMRCTAEEVWDRLPRATQETILRKKIRLYHLNAYDLARDLGLRGRINTLMQVAFFALSDLLPIDEAIERLKKAIAKTYGRKGEKVIAMNCAAVDAAQEHLKAVPTQREATSPEKGFEWVPETAPDFVKRVTARLLAGQGELLPVSAFPVDGVWPTATSRYEKREIATHIPAWNTEACTQCNSCALICPHAAIRPKRVDPEDLANAPESFKSTRYKGPGANGEHYVLQVAPQDCTGCAACVEVCPARTESGQRAIEMQSLDTLLEGEKANFDFFEKLRAAPSKEAKPSPRNLPFKQPLFEFSGACSGCTQTPYVRSLTQLFGDRLIVANATGCSSIYGGNLPTTPYCQDDHGRGPAWANSLFEDNAEFGLGLHLAAERRRSTAIELLGKCREKLSPELVRDLLNAPQTTDREIASQRGRVEALKEILAEPQDAETRRLLLHADYLVKKSTWIIGGDGWAYDIGFGGLDHVLASGFNINILVLDTEVYSNTGGQSSKATPIGAQAKFAAAGKERPKKDLAQIAMTYGQVYVGQIALGANPQQAIDVLREAESFDGPSLVLAYGPCLAHGIDLTHGPARQKAAVETGYWPLFRYDPRRPVGVPPFQLDSFAPETPVSEFMKSENRFAALQRATPERAAELLEAAQAQVDRRFARYELLAKIIPGSATEDDDDDDGWG